MKPQDFEKYLNEVKFDDKPNQAHRDELEKKLIANLSNLSKQPQQKTIAIWHFSNLIIKFAAAAAILIAVFWGLKYFGHSFSFTSVAWADVAQKFQSVEFFSVVFYEKDDALAQPEQIELWMGQGGNVRMRMGSQVIFGHGGKITKAFDMSNRSQVEPDSRGEHMLEMLSSSNGQFSLGTILNVIAKGGLTDVTPLVNSEAIISEDLVVFDSQLYETQWMRIWALRESKLPVHIRIWGSRDGYCLDAFLTYSNKQPDEFFDPDAFNTVFRQQQEINTNIAYAFLTDPGGKDITPKDMFKKNGGYHMPIIKRAGISEEGAFWVIAEKSQNKMPEGWTFKGFSKIEDNLGRTYSRIGNDYDYNSDTSLSVFVPVDFPFDERIPSRVTLICDTEYYYTDKKPEIIGKIDLTEWETSTLCPQLNGSGTKSNSELKINLAWSLTNSDNKERLERLIDSIPGEPEDNNFVYNRERIRLRMLLRNKEFDKAIELGEKLMPLLEKEYKRWKGYASYPGEFNDYISALVYAGQLDEAEETWRHIKRIEPELSSKLNSAGQKRIEEDLLSNFETCLRVMVPDFSRKAELTIDQINKIFGIEIRNNKLFERYTFWDWNPYYDEPRYDPWREHLKELDEYYKIHPLPEKMELFPFDVKKDMKGYLAAVPDNPNYRAEFITMTLKNLLSSRYDSLSPLYKDIIGRLRLSDEIANYKIHHVIVYEKSITEKERHQFILEQLGLEIVEVNEPRKVWVTHYNGQKIKPYEEVKAPVPNEGETLKVGMSPMIGRFSFDYLFSQFVRYQTQDLKAQGIVIIDETSNVNDDNNEWKSIAGSIHNPYWDGPESPEIARKWFHDEFGVTFTEETRQMKTYVVRKRK